MATCCRTLRETGIGSRLYRTGSNRMMAFEPPAWVPTPLLRTGPYQVALWQWLALPALGSRVAKAIVFAMTIIAVISALGYPVASLIAGLGIGGLALALAAQKTVENLFGAFAIGFDQPIREGDFVQIDGIKGSVEAIGLRSPRVRTADRTVVCFPNGRLAETRTENYAARDRFRFYTVLGLTYR